MRGVRILNKKYLEGLAEAFKLNRQESSLFEVLVVLDHANQPDEVVDLIEK